MYILHTCVSVPHCWRLPGSHLNAQGRVHVRASRCVVQDACGVCGGSSIARDINNECCPVRALLTSLESSASVQCVLLSLQLRWSGCFVCLSAYADLCRLLRPTRTGRGCFGLQPALLHNGL